MNQNFLKYLALWMPLLFAACSEETVINNEPDEMLPIKVQVSVPDPTTRTQLTENAGNLAWQWTDNDQLAVTDANGVNKGSLKLISFDNEQHTVATFEGTISSTLPNGDNQLNIIYTPQDPAAVSDTHDCDYSQQDGLFSSLKSRDVLVTTVTAKKTDTYVLIPSFSMSHCFSAGHFSLSFAGESPEISKVEVSGANVRNKAVVDLKNMTWTGTEGTITVNTSSADFYMTLIPADNIDMQFKAYAADGKEYEGSLGVTFNLASATYLRKDLGNGSYAGIPVEMTKVGGEEPDDDVVLPEGVGPTVTINGKKYKFVNGNLCYNVDTHTFGIHEKQTYYLYQPGKGVINKPNTYGSEYLGYDTIDMFSWGATGIGDYTQKPETICKVGGSDNENYVGTNYPFANEAALDNSNFTYLLKPVSMDNPEADFGYAYMITGRNKADTREYITPPLDAFQQLFVSGNLYRGCTIKGAGINGADVTGLIVIPNITLNDAKTLIQSIGCTYTSSISSLTPNSTGNSFNVEAIKLNNYDDLKKLNDALFFPIAGQGALSAENERPGYTSYSKTVGAYWSADGNSGSSTTAMAKRIYFSNKAGFYYNGKSSTNSVYSRHGKLSVRLLVEVTE